MQPNFKNVLELLRCLELLLFYYFDETVLTILLLGMNLDLNHSACGWMNLFSSIFSLDCGLALKCLYGLVWGKFPLFTEENPFLLTAQPHFSLTSNNKYPKFCTRYHKSFGNAQKKYSKTKINTTIKISLTKCTLGIFIEINSKIVHNMLFIFGFIIFIRCCFFDVQ